MAGIALIHTRRAFSKRARERSRVASHLSRAEKFARENAPALDPSRALVRALLLRALREYREDGAFPQNHQRHCNTPVFVDDRGTRCAVGHLLALSGQAPLVDKISSERNLATVHQLSDELGLAQWLDAAGLSLEEAALIQPTYGPTCSSAAQCFCGHFYPVPAGDAGPAQSASAVLECTLLSRTSARVDVIHGTTTGHTVGSLVELPLFDGTLNGQTTRILVPVLADGTQPQEWTARIAGPGVAALALEPDGTATCAQLAVNSGVSVHARAQSVIAALRSDDCASTLAATDPRGNDRVCSGCACAGPGVSAPGDVSDALDPALARDGDDRPPRAPSTIPAQRVSPGTNRSVYVAVVLEPIDSGNRSAINVCITQLTIVGSGTVRSPAVALLTTPLDSITNRTASVPPSVALPRSAAS